LEFGYASSMHRDFPALVTGALRVAGISPRADPSAHIDALHAVAAGRLDTGPESSFPEIVAWRQAFSLMGLKPTQYRCASEALLRRFRKERSLPSIHPLVDLCNAVSMAFAIPIAVIDVAHVAGDLQVRRATGQENYLAFNGSVEHPEPEEVIFADDAGQAHARRWTNRQSATSAVQASTRDVLIVAEALHDGARQDMARLMETLRSAVTATWPQAEIAEVAVAGS
jgi:DNA/RNA-binding domain of Phe-tRNA-synthetase-like protein